MIYSKLKWGLLVAGALAMWRPGVSLLRTPEYEVLYSPDPPASVCADKHCWALYSLEIGNTGLKPQREVAVRLRREFVARAVTPPRARSFGKIDRPVGITEAQGETRYSIARVAPGKRISLSFTLPIDRGSAPPWDDILVGVEATDGRVLRGDPATTSLGRMLYALSGRF